MNNDRLRAAVLRALSTVAPEAEPDSMDPSENMKEQLDLDSLDFLDFVIALKNETGVEVPESDYGRIATLDDCVAYLTSTTATATGPS